MKKIIKKKEKKKLIDYKWILIVTVSAFLISLIFSFIGETVVPNAPMVISLLLVFIFIGLGILFDIVGIAVTVCDPKGFHAMSSKKVKGSYLALNLIKNASKVSSFCNDVIGDICGIISGSTGISIALQISKKLSLNVLLVSLLVTAIIAALTIGGKAIGKSFAISRSNQILFKFSKVLSIFYSK